MRQNANRAVGGAGAFDESCGVARPQRRLGSGDLLVGDSLDLRPDCDPALDAPRTLQGVVRGGECASLRQR